MMYFSVWCKLGKHPLLVKSNKTPKINIKTNKRQKSKIAHLILLVLHLMLKLAERLVSTISVAWCVMCSFVRNTCSSSSSSCGNDGSRNINCVNKSSQSVSKKLGFMLQAMKKSKNILWKEN